MVYKIYIIHIIMKKNVINYFRIGGSTLSHIKVCIIYLGTCN